MALCTSYLLSADGLTINETSAMNNDSISANYKVNEVDHLTVKDNPFTLKEEDDGSRNKLSVYAIAIILNASLAILIYYINYKSRNYSDLTKMYQ